MAGSEEADDPGDPRFQATGDTSVPDYTSAKWAEAAGVDVAVVGDKPDRE